MAEVILMPRLSDTMTEGVIAAWHKKVGDPVKKGELLAEVETDKATMELESYKDGTLLHIGVDKGGKLQVNDLLAIIGKPGEDVTKLIKDSSGNAAKTPEKKEEKKAEKAAPKAKKAAKSQESAGPREGSKTAQVVAMLQRKGGATLEEIMEKMGWQKHTVRGFMAGAMKKAGYTVESFKSEAGARSYRINP